MSVAVSPAADLEKVRQEPARGSEAYIRLAIPCFFYLLLTYILPPPLPVRVEGNLLDPSWQVVLTDGFLRAAQFGRDIVYTYGPWGFVESPRGDPRIYPWLLGARLLLALAFVLGISLIASRGIRRPVYKFLFVASIAILGDPVYVLPMVLLALAVYPNRREDRVIAPIVHLLAIACALTMWIKFTNFVSVGSLAAALAAQDIVKRRLPVIPLEILASALAFWLLAGQSLFGLPSFLHGALSTALSYSSEMFVPGPYGELAYIAGMMLAIAILAAALIFYRRPWSLWPVLGWVALLFVLQLKEAFVRFDDYHLWMGIVNALLPSALILICRAGFFDPETFHPPNIGVLIRVCAASVVVLSVALVARAVKTRAGFERYQALLQNLDGVRALGAGRSLSADYLRQLEDFRHSAPLRQVAGTAAVFPDNQIMLYGNGMQVRMPPIPQSFEAYNPYLSGRNASFFRGANRPDFVFFDIAPIDNRYPSASDTLSWLALMDCYQPAGNSGRYLVLRAAGCEDASLELVAETKVRAGEIVPLRLGGGSPLWLDIDMSLNRPGSFVAALARPPETKLAVHTGRGWRTFSVSPGLARTGFLLSPLLLDAASFGRLLAAGEVDPQMEVRDLAIVQSDLARRFYEPAIGVRMYKLHLRRQAKPQE